jgi:pentatricopeptide repeat protein
VAEVLSTHGANLREREFTQSIGDFGRRRRDLKRVLLFLKAMPTDLIDVFHYSVAISACEKGRKWEKALELLEKMQAKEIEPDVITYNQAQVGKLAAQRYQAQVGKRGA